ncbi:ATP-dependent DNA ligase [Pedobacter sp. SD-b]|uniref:DNA ligase (ATP) n=1 Tax=Pedobacter segetis TaxID=2793069 RepID=A0ABS1BFH1_9SPHI|nr:ATP-dependent DNA ligase [Pedobacter segetis]MBK0381583.1 ATP-dependent DNA ligase [Pedobacter segetis]
MKKFAQLFLSLDETNKTNEKIKVIKEYFLSVSDEDKINMLALFTGRKPKRPINATQLKQWALELSEIPEWLFKESYDVVGDLAETLSLLLPEPQHQQDRNLSSWVQEIKSLKKSSDQEKKEWLLNSLDQMERQEKFVFLKLLTSSFRLGVSQSLVVKAISQISGLETPTLTHRIMGNWEPETFSYQDLTAEEDGTTDISRPYPFFLAYPIQETSEIQKSSEDLQNSLGNASEWQAEFKWDGIRAQLIKRENEIFIWSRGEELATDKFPELHPFMQDLPNGTVLDGEILAFKENQPLPFNILQTRIGRKTISKKMLTDNPVAFIAYDVMEFNDQDIRSKSQEARRSVLEKIQSSSTHQKIFRISEIIKANDWETLALARDQARDIMAEGLMLKRKTATYQVGRKRGDWWKWKIDPLSVDAVMIYAQKGHGRRADLYTDYTFAVWDGDKLVPFAKAYSGLTDKEIAKVDNFVKRNTLERFGPVRTVKPELVFEIGFEGINRSSRHKSGIALRFPRILRWRTDKKKEEADTLESLILLLQE